MSGRTKRPEASDLQKLLVRCCHPDEKGRRSLPILAAQLGLAGYTIYKWVDADRLPTWRVSDLVDHAPESEGVTVAEFLPYVFKH